MKLQFLLAVVAIFTLAALTEATDEYFDSNGVKIHYVSVGKGEPIVLIHGWMSDASMWGKDSAGNAKPQGSPGYQVIAMDCRGHGKSEKLYDKTQYGIEMAEDVVRLLDHLKIKKAHLIGYSMGAFIVGNIAAKHPDRVISAVYGGQAPLIATENNTSREIDIFAKAVEEGRGLGAYIIYVTPSDRPKPAMEQANALAAFMLAGKDARALALAGKSFPELAVSIEDLRRCKAPSLYIYGSKDSKATQERVALLRRKLGQGELKVVGGADHVTTLTRPEFGKAILDFLAAHKPK
jgi:pimeloyl-ACP methyl ester carboxylesterase